MRGRKRLRFTRGNWRCFGAWVQVAETGDLTALRTVLSAMSSESDDYHLSTGDRYWLHWLARDYDAALKALADTKEEWVLNMSVDLFFPKAMLAGFALQAKGDKPAAARAFEQSR